MAEQPKPRGPVDRAVPPGDNRERLVCGDCGFILYDNPKIVVGSVVRFGARYLLCRRAIEPRTGYWTLPAGYLELNETTEDGALREAWEEARARIRIEGLLAIYNIPRLSQVQMIYRAQLLDEAVAPGPESREVGLFTWDQIPWNEIAFPSVNWSLDADRALGDAPPFRPATNAAGDLGRFPRGGL
ncbi:MAG TPA: NUDIX hydrolase [Candidatus Sulfotelmatobacter sp.]|nr:NUDIX hydrolase [Candidatus Sulfotelmatobacter sp.]